MLPPEGQLMKERKKNSQFSVLQVLPCPTQHWLPPMRSKPDVDIIGPLSSVSEEQGAPSSSCWKLTSSLPLPLPSGQSSVCPFRVCLIQSVSMETLRQEESAPPPVPLPLSPNLWDFTVLLPCDSIVSQQPLYTNKTDYLHAIVEKDTACSGLYIGFLHPAKRGLLPPHPS